MGLTAIVSSASAGVSSATSLLSPVGAGVGGIFVAAALVGLLAYLDLFDASEHEKGDVRSMLIATTVPLLLTFSGIVLFQSLAVV